MLRASLPRGSPLAPLTPSSLPTSPPGTPKKDWTSSLLADWARWWWWDEDDDDDEMKMMMMMMMMRCLWQHRQVGRLLYVEKSLVTGTVCGEISTRVASPRRVTLRPDLFLELVETSRWRLSSRCKFTASSRGRPHFSLNQPEKVKTLQFEIELHARRPD